MWRASDLRRLSARRIEAGESLAELLEFREELGSLCLPELEESLGSELMSPVA